jgi:hypothetical protein
MFRRQKYIMRHYLVELFCDPSWPPLCAWGSQFAQDHLDGEQAEPELCLWWPLCLFPLKLCLFKLQILQKLWYTWCQFILFYSLYQAFTYLLISMLHGYIHTGIDEIQPVFSLMIDRPVEGLIIDRCFSALRLKRTTPIVRYSHCLVDFCME